jgi:hypothetical protein
MFGYDSKKPVEFTNTERDKDSGYLYKSEYFLLNFSACFYPKENKLYVTGGSNDRTTTLGRRNAVELTFKTEENGRLKCDYRQLPNLCSPRSHHKSMVVRDHLIVMFGKQDEKVATTFEYLDLKSPTATFQ